MNVIYLEGHGLQHKGRQHSVPLGQGSMESCLAQLIQMVEVWSKCHILIENKVIDDRLRGGIEGLVQRQIQIPLDTGMACEGKLTRISAYLKILGNSL